MATQFASGSIDAANLVGTNGSSKGEQIVNLGDLGLIGIRITDIDADKRFFHRYNPSVYVSDLTQADTLYTYIFRSPPDGHALIEGYEALTGDLVTSDDSGLIDVTGAFEKAPQLPADLLSKSSVDPNIKNPTETDTKERQQENSEATSPATKAINEKAEFPVCLATICYAEEGVRLTKEFNLDEQGNLKKHSAPNLLRGSALTTSKPLDELLEYVAESNQCLILGAIQGVGENTAVPLTTLENLSFVRRDRPNTIARSKDHFSFPDNKPIYGFIDHDPDPCTFPPINPLCFEELIKAIDGAWPESGFREAAKIYRPSSSAGVRRESDPQRDASQVYEGSGHISVVFAPGVDPRAWTQTLFAKLIESGYGAAYVNKRGNVDVRTLIDRTVAQACRVQYTANAVLGPGVVRDELQRSEDQWMHSGTPILSSRAFLYSDRHIQRIVEDERRNLLKLPEVKEAVNRQCEARRLEQVDLGLAQGLSQKEAEQRAKQFVQRIRTNSDVIELLDSDGITLRLQTGQSITLENLLMVQKVMSAGGVLAIWMSEE